MKRTKSSSTGKYMHRSGYIHTMHYDLAIQRSEPWYMQQHESWMYDLIYMKYKNRQAMEIKAHTSGMRGGAVWETAWWNLLGWRKGSISTFGCELVTWGHAFDKTSWTVHKRSKDWCIPLCRKHLKRKNNSEVFPNFNNCMPMWLK